MLALMLLFATYLFFYHLFGNVELMWIFATPTVLFMTIAWLLIDRKAKHGN